MKLTKTKFMATIYDGHTHIERRVYRNDMWERFVKINNSVFTLNEIKKYNTVDIWFE